MNDTPLLIRAIRKEETPRSPVWLMRQAGRYLSEYRALKEQYSFLELCRTRELALQVTMQPIDILNVDAAIMFADILLPLESLGIEFDFNPGPKILNPVKSAADVTALHNRGVGCLQYVFDIMHELKQTLSRGYPGKAAIGFAGAPWTMACYLIDQGPFKHFDGTKIFAQSNQQAMAQLLDKLTAVVSEYLLGQLDAGADVVQLFDSWAGTLCAEDYQRYALPYVQRIVDDVHKAGGLIIYYVNGSSHLLECAAASGADCISIDWRTDLDHARRVVGEDTALQGNFDPTWLYLDNATVASRVQEMMETGRQHPGYIVNLGHGILQTTPVENVRTFVDTVLNS